MIYDYIIIGGGLAGVYCAYKLSSKFKILLIEKESKLGGRGLMINWHQKDIRIGAGIGSPENLTLIKLMKELKFPYVESKGENGFIDDTDKFDQSKFVEQIKNKVNKYQSLGKQYNHLTVLQFLKENFPKDDVISYLEHCEYIDFINSDIDYYLKFYPIEDNISGPYTIFYIDWMKLVKVMEEKIRQNGGDIRLNCEINSQERFEDIIKVNCNQIQFQAKNIIFALTLKPLQKLISYPVSNYIGSVPFVRIYTFHKNGHNFKGKNIKGYTILKDNYLQKVIIMSDKILMASYSDSFYADYWKKYLNDKEKLKKKVLKYLRKVVSETSDIDDVYIYYWSEGVHYYKPTSGRFDEIHRKIINPEKNYYICGEIVSRRQGWVDGALSSVDDLQLF
jgi:hypothetical protein